MIFKVIFEALFSANRCHSSEIRVINEIFLGKCFRICKILGGSEPQKFYFIKVLFLKAGVHFLPNPGKRPKPGIRRPLPSDDLIKMYSFRVKYG